MVCCQHECDIVLGVRQNLMASGKLARLSTKAKREMTARAIKLQDSETYRSTLKMPLISDPGRRNDERWALALDHVKKPEYCTSVIGDCVS